MLDEVIDEIMGNLLGMCRKWKGGFLESAEKRTFVQTFLSKNENKI